MVSPDEGFSSDEETNVSKTLSKKEKQELERRRLKNKKKKQSKRRRGAGEDVDGGNDMVALSTDEKQPEAVSQSEGEENGPKTLAETLEVEIDYVGEAPKLDESDPNYQYFNAIFNAFKIEPNAEDGDSEDGAVSSGKEHKKDEETNRASISERILQEEINDRDPNDPEKMSRRKLRLAMQPSIAKLKESTRRPDVVEWADVTSRDPFILVALKSYRNTVPVPRHWNAKRKYLSGKRGFERPPFELPDFIKRTGIQDMREALWEKEESQNLKSKMRERARPKLGKIDIDYQKLHDAFFKWQTKPPMTMMGELYYEGKEVETLMRDKKPGNLSDELRIALGMPVGPNAHKFPPPWLIAMQRYGPPQAIKYKDSRSKCSYSRGMCIRVSCWWMGKTASR